MATHAREPYDEPVLCDELGRSAERSRYGTAGVTES